MADSARIRPAWSAPGERDSAEIERVLAFRAERAIREFSGMARAGPERHCPICEYRGVFSAKGHKPSVWCPQCDSRPRHRLMRLWLGRKAAVNPEAEVIHFAAEPWARTWFEARAARYRTADITDAFDLKLDIEAMDLPDASVDILIANHVLEHVDDGAALAEIARVLRPGGTALLTVPLVEGWDETYEDDALDEPTRRLRMGDPDHKRFYGRDFRARIAAAGLTLSEFAATEPDVSTHGLHRGERLFIAGRPA